MYMTSDDNIYDILVWYIYRYMYVCVSVCCLWCFYCGVLYFMIFVHFCFKLTRLDCISVSGPFIKPERKMLVFLTLSLRWMQSPLTLYTNHGSYLFGNLLFNKKQKKKKKDPVICVQMNCVSLPEHILDADSGADYGNDANKLVEWSWSMYQPCHRHGCFGVF